jgi:hemolysin D
MALSRAEAQARVLTELAKAEADVELRRSELAKAIQRSSLQRLLSPVDGVVSQSAESSRRQSRLW